MSAFWHYFAILIILPSATYSSIKENPAIAPGFSFLEGGAQWWAIRFEPGAIGNGKSSTLSPSAKLR